MSSDSPSGTSMAASLPNSAASVSENAVARNQVPIIRLITRTSRRWPAGSRPAPATRHWPSHRWRRPAAPPAPAARMTAHRSPGPMPTSPACRAPSRGGPSTSTMRRKPVPAVPGTGRQDRSANRRSAESPGSRAPAAPASVPRCR
ncbi:hypothetical protein G6F22_020284 [Rhizopus arrhizus]|nr:hypothetical protein G6F22_020284 [Rhizopus arrhizus]